MVDEAQLARLAATGAGLLHVGHRWVRIDADDIRRAHRRMIRLRSGSSTVGAAACSGSPPSPRPPMSIGDLGDGDGDDDD